MCTGTGAVSSPKRRLRRRATPAKRGIGPGCGPTEVGGPARRLRAAGRAQVRRLRAAGRAQGTAARCGACAGAAAACCGACAAGRAQARRLTFISVGSRSKPRKSGCTWFSFCPCFVAGACAGGAGGREQLAPVQELDQALLQSQGVTTTWPSTSPASSPSITRRTRTRTRTHIHTHTHTHTRTHAHAHA